MIDKQDILAAFRFRHACKQFDPAKKIPDEDFGFILETGRLSPSSFGLEPWRFVVIQNPALREKLKATVWGAQGQLPTASHFVAILCRKDMRFDSPFVERFMREVQRIPDENRIPRTERLKKFQESDMKFFDSPRGLFEWSCRQAYIALGNMMTSAAMLGIDSCPIEGFDLEQTEALLAAEGVLDRTNWGLAVMVAFGYRINPQPEKTRQKTEDVVAWVR